VTIWLASRKSSKGNMATQADVRRIALSFPETEEEDGRFAFAVRNKGKLKGFAWVWLERVTPKKARVPNLGVLAVRVPNLARKDLMVSTEPAKFFTEPHYNGFPAVLVRLDAVSIADLRMLLADAWRCQAPSSLTKSPRSKPAAKAARSSTRRRP
jgi:hypothetical protein